MTTMYMIFFSSRAIPSTIMMILKKALYLKVTIVRAIGLTQYVPLIAAVI